MLQALVVIAVLLVTCALRPAAQTAPKLVVVIVVDQLRADYLTRFDRHWRAGFRTVLREGAVFERANYPYFSTVTCPGHATIGTGAFPRTHGMLANTWWRRDERRSPECTADAKVPAVSYGPPVEVGSSPGQLMAPTLADELRTQKPGTRIVALSLKSRGAIPLAGQAGDAVVWFDDPAGTFATSRSYAPAPVPAVKRFVDANPYEKDFGRSWTLHGPPASYIHRDSGIGERPPAPWTSLFPHPLVVPAGRGATPAAIAAAQRAQLSGLWQSTPFADAYLGRMAISLADSFELGRRNATDFLSISFSALDDIGHGFGPESREVEDVLRHLDVTLGTVIDALDTRVGRANYVLALSADHGVDTFSGFGRVGRVHNEDVRDRIEEALIAHFGALQKGVYVDSVQSGHAYLAPGVFDRLKAAPAAMATVKAAVEEIPGVAQLLRADQLSDMSRDAATRAAALSYVPGRAGDLLIVVEEHWSLLGRTVFSANHGSIYPYDSHVPMIFFGGPIRPGRHSTPVTPADIAPTLAQFAGVTMAKAEGRALRETRR
jgi:predicted AlkP superfamily pyrophosphatase or phosphodiesterase